MPRLFFLAHEVSSLSRRKPQLCMAHQLKGKANNRPETKWNASFVHAGHMIHGLWRHVSASPNAAPPGLSITCSNMADLSLTKKDYWCFANGQRLYGYRRLWTVYGWRDEVWQTFSKFEKKVAKTYWKSMFQSRVIIFIARVQYPPSWTYTAVSTYTEGSLLTMANFAKPLHGNQWKDWLENTAADSFAASW